MSILYERTRRLGPPILAHYILNLMPFTAFLAAPPR
jgi:membrane protease YdiL (CAAX protease family)